MIVYFYKNKKGFTLIELLVVISVISLLSSIVLSSLNSARAKSRDSKRIQDLVQIRTALELYAADHDGHYPVNKQSGIAFGWVGTDTSLSGSGCTSSKDITVTKGLDELVAQKYISKIPEDPKPTSTTCYLYYGIPNDWDNPSYAIGYKFIVSQTIETINTQTTKHSLRDMKGDIVPTLCYPVSKTPSNIYTLTASLAIASPGVLDPYSANKPAECL